MAAIRHTGPDASVEEMAAAAGVSKPVLYAEFGDKHGIGEAIAVELAERSERRMMEALAASDTLEMATALRHAIDGFIDLVADEPEIYRFIVRSIRSADQGLLDNSLVRTLQARFELAAGVLVPGGDPAVTRILAHATFGFMVAAVESWQGAGRPPRDELVQSLVTVLASGFEAVASGAAPNARQATGESAALRARTQDEGAAGALR
jgi:AcrR family transcriptional regulator